MSDPQQRAAELDTTGVPQPYVVAYKALVESPVALEARAHQRFAAVRQRQAREWFRGGAPEVIVALRELMKPAGPLYEHLDPAVVATMAANDARAARAAEEVRAVKVAEEARTARAPEDDASNGGSQLLILDAHQSRLHVGQGHQRVHKCHPSDRPNGRAGVELLRARLIPISP